MDTVISTPELAGVISRLLLFLAGLIGLVWVFSFIFVLSAKYKERKNKNGQ